MPLDALNQLWRFLFSNNNQQSWSVFLFQRRLDYFNPICLPDGPVGLQWVVGLTLNPALSLSKIVNSQLLVDIPTKRRLIDFFLNKFFLHLSMYRK